MSFSRPMLALLREQAAERELQPTVWQADLRSVGTNYPYSVAMIPYNSLCNLIEIDDQLAALETLYEVLEPGGRLLLDVFIPQYHVIANSFGEWQSPHEFEYNGRQLAGQTRATIDDVARQTYRTEHKITDSNGDEVVREEFVVSHLPPQQGELLVRQSPFDTWSIFGGFDREPLTDGDSVQVWELQKETP